ncbi:phosphoribosylformylglycinamidine synthase subunit PurS [Limosilactobacillus mucosae]|uniref:phosphoribosylformylglycinamidine synthase subunit PurS n=1 Tax=Limosilactobacillus mucosae TaxID=97478 RepID=UPI00233EF702|nr:phosphoribosylformylglycinamidine synthase subunit PurS [Limosilactobacillus mucosae]MDC2844513.1 phosphoribosylformylglycinamidine synthase subunit PurS [Limosilactobacillus mucosae]
MTTVRIYVTYKQSVFDPQAESVLNAIHQLGHDEVKDLMVGKFFDLQVEGDQAAVENTVKEVAESLLVNFNIETYKFEVLEAK